MISQTAEYALRAAICLADNNGLLTSRQIARRAQVPVDYLHKVLQALARAGLVRAQRGLHGGFSLACKPEQVSVLDVINAVDPLRRVRECPLGLDEHHDRLCPLHHRLDHALQLVESAFAKSNLAEIIHTHNGSKPLGNKTDDRSDRPTKKTAPAAGK